METRREGEEAGVRRLEGVPEVFLGSAICFWLPWGSARNFCGPPPRVAWQWKG
jgi:hypothetical protein